MGKTRISGLWHLPAPRQRQLPRKSQRKWLWLCLSVATLGAAPVSAPGLSIDLAAGPATPIPPLEETMTVLRISAITPADVATLRPGDAVVLDLGAISGRLLARTRAVSPLEDGRIAWTGEVIREGQPAGDAALVIRGPAVTGSVHAGDGRTFRIMPGPEGNRVIATDHGAMPPD